MHGPSRFASRACVALLSLVCACSDEAAPTADGGTTYTEPGTKLGELSYSAADRAALQAIQAELSELSGLTSTALIEKRALRLGGPLGYDAKSAAFLDLIQASSLALDARELDKLGEQGFVITPRHAFPNMAYGYRTLYAEDLPVYVSLDAILETVHLSYDAILKALEERYLTDALRTLLVGARARLQTGAVADARVAADLDLYFAVALSLLDGDTRAPVAGADAVTLDKLVTAAERADGIERISLFGALRAVDFSQLLPRGHYEDSDALKRYFRATMWLGRTDFRLIETLPDGSTVFRRRQLEAALALRSVVSGEGRAAFDLLDRVIGAFVGEHDFMQLSQLDALLADLGGDVATKSDQEIAQTIIEKGYGAQRIASQVIFKEPSAASQTLPLDRSFALLGQRYTVDSHVFSSVVYDRVNHPGVPRRTLPDPLDAAYAALGNSAALPLLKDQLDTYAYAPDLERMRLLVDRHGEGYFGANLYNLWLSSLRAVSPDSELLDPDMAGLPRVAGSERWQRRLLNTQLASWAELRHDTILYVKQSYTSGAVCEFPDGYVDPYPEAFERLRLYALKGRELVALLPTGGSTELSTRMQTYFAELATVAATLRDMAQHERTGMPFTAEQMAFLNDAVRSQAEVCGGPVLYEGWYARLLFDKSDEDMEPTIADVHTDPGGDRPPKVLHVGTGLPRLMVVTIETCEGPRAYAGVASAYHEVITDLNRLTDSKWAERLRSSTNKPADVPWMGEVLP